MTCLYMTKQELTLHDTHRMWIQTVTKWGLGPHAHWTPHSYPFINQDKDGDPAPIK